MIRCPFNDKRATTMTAEWRVLRANTLFAPNDVLLVPGSDGIHDLATVAWIRADGKPPRLTHAKALERAWSAVHVRFPLLAPCLLVAQTAWQPSSPMARHRGLWSSIEAIGLELPRGRRAPTHVTHADGKLRHAGALWVDVDAFDCERVMRLLHAEPMSHLVAVASDSRLVDALLQGASTRGPSLQVVEQVVRGNGLVFWPLGAFDDHEAGVAVLGGSAMIEALAAGGSRDGA